MASVGGTFATLVGAFAGGKIAESAGPVPVLAVAAAAHLSYGAWIEAVVWADSYRYAELAVGLPERLHDGLTEILGQVVDAVGIGGEDEKRLVVGRLAEGIQGVQGGLGDGHPGASTQGADGAAPQPCLVAGLVSFLEPRSGEPRFVKVAEQVVSGRVVAGEPALQAVAGVPGPLVVGRHVAVKALLSA